MSGTVSLVIAVVAKRISVEEENNLHNIYKEATKGECPAGAAPTRDQLSAFKAVLYEEEGIDDEFAA